MPVKKDTIYRLTTLENGLNVLTVYMPGMQSLSLGVWVRTGGRYESRKNAGISHFIEHLLFEGTKKRSGDEIKRSIEGIGGCLNGFTSEEATCYLVKVLGKHKELSMDVLADMVLDPLMSEKSIEKERSVITEEIKMYRDLPGHHVADLLSELMWPGHPLGMNLAGTIETVSGMRKKDLLGYKEKYYAPCNTIVVAAGDVRHEDIIEAAKRHFTGGAERRGLGFRAARVAQKTPASNLHFKQTEQMHVAMGVHSVSSSDPDRFAVSLLHVMLGANMSSRLFQEVREKRGLAYEIATSVKKYKDTGAFCVSCGVKNEKVCEAIEVILHELARIKAKKVPGEELARAQEFYAGQLLFGLEDTQDHMLWAGEQMISRGRINTSSEVLRNMYRVTADDIKRVAGEIFNSRNLNLAVIGHLDDSRKARLSKVITNL